VRDGDESGIAKRKEIKYKRKRVQVQKDEKRYLSRRVTSANLVL
jgi:hypothetical protein